jgi:hypothetical protein
MLAPAPGEPEAIFVVGVSRSGTTLLSRVLAHHPRVAIAPENHYLRHLLPKLGVRHDIRRLGDLEDDAVVRNIAGRISEGRLQGLRWARANSPFFVWLTRQVPRETLEARLLAAERTERGLFTALLRIYADTKGKAIIGEKTPAHVACVDELLEWYPGGKVVHIVRDPRGVFASELRRRTENATSLPYRWLVHLPLLLRWFILLQVVCAWAQAVTWHRRLSKAHPDAYLQVHFEDLVTDPEATVRRLADFLGLNEHRRMLRQKVVSKGENVGDAGFDADAAERWRRSIRADDKRTLERLLGHRLREMGYPAE